MASEVEICNSALSKLGSEPINSFTEESKQAKLCQRQYPIIRDELLASHYWNFAMKRAVLALVPSTGTAERRYQYTYQIPADSVRVVHLGGKQVETDFKVEGDKIVTDIPSATLLYISKATDVAKYSPTFREALSYRLAEDMAYPLIQSITMMNSMAEKSRLRLADARSFDGQEGIIDPLEADEWLDSRKSRGGRFNG